ncbi:hypothetical protein Bhz59_00087 [Stenotrophomonas phage vB_SmaS_Bhz59]
MKNWTERAAEAALAILAEHFEGDKPVPPPARGNGTGLAHLHWMARELAKGDMSPTKACRWLGYLQAGLIHLGFSDLDTEKMRNQRTGDRELGEPFLTPELEAKLADFLRLRATQSNDPDEARALMRALDHRRRNYTVRVRGPGLIYMELD